MFIPVISTLVCGMIFLCVFAIPLAYIMNVFQQWIISLNGGAKAVIGGVIGACMGFDMGGPINKTASMAANALGADGINGPMAAKIIGGMTPPIGIFIAALLKKSKFSKVEQETAKTALPMGLCFITEGVLPFAAADPARVIPSSMIGSAVAGAVAVGMGCESVAGHGGIFVVPMMKNPLWFLIALVIGSAVTGIIYAVIKRPLEEQEEKEEEELDFDLDIKIQ
jgi:PTS system fructose-specific IIC component